MEPDVHPLTAYRLNQTPPLSVEAMAERAGCSKSTIWRIENGGQGFNSGLLRRIVAATNNAVTASDLLAALPEPQAAE